jgi:hypothetical protein
MSLPRLVLMGEIRRVDEAVLVLFADVMQQSGLSVRSNKPKAPKVYTAPSWEYTRRQGVERLCKSGVEINVSSSREQQPYLAHIACPVRGA